MKKVKKNNVFRMSRRVIVTMVLALSMAVTVFAGLAYAASPDVMPFDHSDYYDDFENVYLAAGGVARTMGSVREKKLDPDYAFFVLQQVQNSSGYPCYVNVRAENGVTIVGTAASVTGTGSFHVNYGRNYGIVGYRYIASAQTSSQSPSGAFLSGYWRP